MTNPTNPYTLSPSATTPPPKKGMSGCAIASIIVGVIVLIFIGLGVWGYFAFKDNFSTDPIKVQAMADQIVEIELGDKWTPQLSMDMLIVRMAIYTSTNAQGMVVLMNGDSKMGSGEQFEAQMRAEMTKSTDSQDGVETTVQVSSERRDFMLRGKPHAFLVVNSEGSTSKEKFLEVSGSFESAEPGRNAFILIKAPETTYSIEEIEAAIASIK